MALVGTGVVVFTAVAALTGLLHSSGTFRAPSDASLGGLSVRARIVAIASSQIGYRTEPRHSYCNKFSAHWDAGDANCPHHETAEQWCADFAAWVWERAGIHLSYGYDPGQINGGAISFYAWGLAHGDWHPAGRGYVASPGDVAVYGLSLGQDPSAAHVAIVTGDPRGQRGPNVINGDGDRTGFSAVEAATDQTSADDDHHRRSRLAGYVSPRSAS